VKLGRASAMVLLLLLAFRSGRPAGAQQLGPSTGGLVAVDQARRFLGHNKRVLMIGAHPDDEDTELLTILARGLGAEAAYLALTRGEGGQNLIGAELGAGLGVLRTEELLGARALDGARQYFTRTYDFGYSKGLPDTWRTWPKDSVLKDVVRIIRRFQPQVIVSVFSGTPRDGHGQHQAAGWAAREAFQAAGDPARFPELAVEEALVAWTPLKLYRSARFDTAGATLTLEGGVLDSAVGQSFLQIAMRGRSLHRSQDMGVLQRMGPSRVRLALEADRTGMGAGGLFAGIDTSLAGIRPGSPAAIDQQRRNEDVLFATSGVLCDAVSDDEQVVPGQRVTFTLSCWNASRDTTTVTGVLTAGAQASEGFRARVLEPGGMLTANVTLTVPADAPITQPYFLARMRRSGASRSGRRLRRRNSGWPRAGPSVARWSIGTRIRRWARSGTPS
jgi:LmbE family N-acetylglucosaminyl deacetylase